MNGLSNEAIESDAKMMSVADLRAEELLESKHGNFLFMSVRSGEPQHLLP